MRKREKEKEEKRWIWYKINTMLMHDVKDDRPGFEEQKLFDVLTARIDWLRAPLQGENDLKSKWELFREKHFSPHLFSMMQMSKEDWRRLNQFEVWPLGSDELWSELRLGQIPNFD